MTKMVEYPFPIRPNFIASLHLPLDLTRDEAMRLIRFVDSLPVDRGEMEREENGQAISLGKS